MTDINVGLWVTNVTTGKMGRALPPPNPPVHTYHVDRNVLHIRIGSGVGVYERCAAIVQNASAEWLVLVKTGSTACGWTWPEGFMKIEVPRIPEAGVWLLPEEFHLDQMVGLDGLVEQAIIQWLKVPKKYDRFREPSDYEKAKFERIATARGEYTDQYKLNWVEPVSLEDILLDVEMRHKRFREDWNSPEKVLSRKRAEARKMLKDITGGSKK